LLEAEEEFSADTAVELRIGFSVVRLERDDPDEQIFRSLLVHSEHDLAEFSEPIAIPIFGRGRTYFALVGEGINPSTIDDNSRFLCGDCSCQVKDLNPGMDMLFAVNWDAHVRRSALADTALPELTGIGGLEILDVAELEKTADQVAYSAASRQTTAAPPGGTAAVAPPEGAQVTQASDPSADPSVDRAVQASAAEPVPQPSSTASPDAPSAPRVSLLSWTIFLTVALLAAVVVVGSLLMRTR
jgi:hypothetical protein